MNWLDELSVEAKRQIDPYGLVLFTSLILAMFIEWVLR